MAIEIHTEAPETDLPPATLEPEAPEPNGKAKRSRGAYVKVADRPDSQVYKAVREGENRTLREIIEAFGTEGAYQIAIHRKDPDEVVDRATGKTVITAGFLKQYDNKPIDEDFLLQHFGGGTYEIKFKERRAGGSGWQYAGQKIVKIAGDPLLHTLPGGSSTQPGGAPPAATESPSIVKEAMTMMQDGLRRAEERADRAATAPRTNDAVIDLLREQLAAANAQTEALRAEIREVRRAPPESPDEKIKDKLLDKLMDGDSARLQAVRLQYESELRTTRDNALENERRLRDSFDRDKADLRNSHERELALVRTSMESQVTIARSSYETQLAAHKSSFETQIALLKAENQRLQAESDRLRDEVKDLRAKKELSITDMAKQVKEVKEAFGDDDQEDSSIGAKLIELGTSPEAWQGISQVIRGPQAAAPAAPAEPRQIEAKRRVVRLPDGKKYILEADGKTMVGPLPDKKKGKPKADAGEPAAPQMPEIDPAIMGRVVGFLETAFVNGQEAEVVAQGARTVVPEEILIAIRDHGVDQVMSKVAKLPSTSPLSTQAGRNWVRQLGKALVGE